MFTTAREAGDEQRTREIAARHAPQTRRQAPAGPPKPKRDWKKGVLLFGLSVVAWLATATGMLELIEANLGPVPLPEKIAVGLAVAMLQIMIVWLLDQLFSPIHFTVKSLYTVGYLFLSLISVGFAFGFYWKVLESRGESTRSAESSIGQVQNALHGADTRLDQLSSTLDTLAAISTQKAEQESANGNSCPGSKPGAGPRMAMRKADAEKFTFASQFVKGRAGQVKGDIKALEGDLQKIVKDDRSIIDAKTGTRNDFLRGMGRKLDETVTRYNALRTDPQLRQIRADAAERAEKTTFPDTRGGTYACPDGQLQSALRGVVAAIDQLPALEKPKIAATEGSEAVIEAFRRLTTTLYGVMQFKLPPSPEELRAQQLKAVQSVEGAGAQQKVNLEGAGLGRRDYIPLAIAIFVDFCLLMVSFGRPRGRFDRLAEEVHNAAAGPVAGILGDFREIHDDRLTRKDFELLQHIIFHFGNHYMAAVPLGAPRADVDGKALTEEQRARLREEAHMLANMFSGLEQDGQVVERGLPPFMALAGGVRHVRGKLKRQDSKFANAGDFRIYRFKTRAWPEFILQAVRGAAREHEQALAKRRAEDARLEAEERQAEAELRARERDAKAARRETEEKLAAEEREAELEFKKMELEARLNERRAQLQATQAEAARKIAEAELARIEADRMKEELRNSTNLAYAARGRRPGGNGNGGGMGGAGGQGPANGNGGFGYAAAGHGAASAHGFNGANGHHAPHAHGPQAYPEHAYPLPPDAAGHWGPGAPDATGHHGHAANGHAAPRPHANGFAWPAPAGARPQLHGNGHAPRAHMPASSSASAATMATPPVNNNTGPAAAPRAPRPSLPADTVAIPDVERMKLIEQDPASAAPLVPIESGHELRAGRDWHGVPEAWHSEQGRALAGRSEPEGAGADVPGIVQAWREDKGRPRKA